MLKGGCSKSVAMRIWGTGQSTQASAKKGTDGAHVLSSSCAVGAPIQDPASAVFT